MVTTRACVSRAVDADLRSFTPLLRPNHAKLLKEIKKAIAKRFYTHSQRLGGSGRALGPEFARLVHKVAEVTKVPGRTTLARPPGHQGLRGGPPRRMRRRGVGRAAARVCVCVCVCVCVGGGGGGAANTHFMPKMG